MCCYTIVLRLPALLCWNGHLWSSHCIGAISHVDGKRTRQQASQGPGKKISVLQGPLTLANSGNFKKLKQLLQFCCLLLLAACPCSFIAEQGGLCGCCKKTCWVSKGEQQARREVQLGSNCSTCWAVGRHYQTLPGCCCVYSQYH